MTNNRFMKMRLDRSQITPEGYLKSQANATRVGVFTYILPDGSSRKELRPASEVFMPASMETLKGKPITNDHPRVPVTAENATSLARGWTHDDVTPGETLLTVGITVMDASLIEAIQNGMQEVSCGYTADLDYVPGRYQGEDYDAVQRNIRYNHLAVVPRGRAGPEVRIRLDAAEENESQDEEIRMPVARVKLGRSNVEVDLPIEAAGLVRDAFKQDAMTLEELEAEVMSLKAMVETLQGAKSALEEQVKSSEDELEMAKNQDMSEEKMDSLIEERIALRTVASNILEAGKHDINKMKPMEIKKACLAAKLPALKLDGKSDDFINGCFDSISVSAPAHSATAQTGNTASRNDGMFDSVAARKAAMERDANAWKRK